MTKFQIIYLAACPISWYLLAGAFFALNSGQLGRHYLLFPFQCFAEEVRCYWFGGKRYRIKFIQERCDGNGFMMGSKKSYSYEDIRNNNLYEEVFWEMCGGRIAFWSEHISFFFLGPIIIALMILALTISSLINILLVLPFKYMFSKRSLAD